MSRNQWKYQWKYGVYFSVICISIGVIGGTIGNRIFGKGFSWGNISIILVELILLSVAFSFLQKEGEKEDRKEESNLREARQSLIKILKSRLADS